MGNSYELFCTDCKEYFDLGSEIVWWSNEESMYCLKDFLLSHTNHNLKVGGDEWNCAYDYGEGLSEQKQLPSEDYKEYDSTYSREDFKEEKE